MLDSVPVRPLYAAVVVGLGYGAITTLVKDRGAKFGGYLVGFVLFGTFAFLPTYLLFRFDLYLPFLLFVVAAQRTYFATYEPSPGEEFVGLLAVTAVALPVLLFVGVAELLVRSTFL